MRSRFILTLLSLMLISASVFCQTKGQRFSRADSLRGMLTPLRTCYDVTFYNLDLRVDPLTELISGSNTIQFDVISSFSKMQIDLSQELDIKEIVLDDKSRLNFEREFGAVFVDIAKELKKGSSHFIEVYYSGKPVNAKRPPWQGGMIWSKNKYEEPWVAVTCQGDGASLWWPNKDHQSDEPDSMLISITVPPGLQNVSNGRLRKVKTLEDNWTKFSWFVSYPINNYNVTLNIGKFAHFSDVYVGTDTLTLDYYVLPENLEKAKVHFEQVKKMMEAFEFYMGQYPFIRDGYKLIESPHLGMEHQSAVAYGNDYLSGYRGRAPAAAGLKFDFIIIHESAHEWWGNSITSNDIADMWIHESFGAYCESLFIEYWYGYDEAINYISGKGSSIANDRPMIGPFNVNTPGSGDMYNKGQLVLNTLRHVINNDSLWFAMFKGMLEEFKYQSIDGTDIFNYINTATGEDYSYFFDQYFNTTNVPRLDVFINKQADKSTARIRWSNVNEDFKMPVKITAAKDKFEFIYPTTSWQKIELGNIVPEEFEIAKDLFYVELNLNWSYLDPKVNFQF